MKFLSIVVAALLIASNAFAHEASKGPNGGAPVDAGNYHVEIVAKDTALTVFLHDENERPIDAKGYKATGIFVVNGKPERIELKADSANKLTGSSSVPLPAKMKGTVQITLPTGKTVQAKFE
jgi:hypothetical protein